MKRYMFGVSPARGWLILALLVLVMMGSGCAPEPEETAAMRADARWKLVLARDYETAWDYLSPGFRETTQRFDYARDRSSRPFRFLSAEVISEECEEDICKIKVLVSYRAIAAPAGMGKMNLSRELEETWIRVDGTWWMVEN